NMLRARVIRKPIVGPSFENPSDCLSSSAHAISNNPAINKITQAIPTSWVTTRGRPLKNKAAVGPSQRGAENEIKWMSRRVLYRRPSEQSTVRSVLIRHHRPPHQRELTWYGSRLEAIRVILVTGYNGGLIRPRQAARGRGADTASTHLRYVCVFT